MNKLSIVILFSLISLISVMPVSVFAAQKAESHPEHSAKELHHDGEKTHSSSEEGHDSGHDEHNEEVTGVLITPENQKLVGIKAESLQSRNLDYDLYAPGEIQANGYTSYLVSPRVDSVVMKRHKALGDHVKQGDALVTLFSASVAEAQATLKVAEAEWQRVKELGRQVVGANRYITAQNGIELAKARLMAFGLSESAVNDPSMPLGEYTLIANISGAILSDDFQQGQRIEAGHALMLLSDESELWVEARVQASEQLDLPVGTTAQVKVGASYYHAKVSQEAHTIDETTRTRVIRLLINNPDDRLHPGQFADVYFSLSTEKPVMAVPENALLRSGDGDWTVFVEIKNNTFFSQEVKLGRVFGDYHEISGVNVGSQVVTSGAFFVSSEMAKGGFDPHNH